MPTLTQMERWDTAAMKAKARAIPELTASRDVKRVQDAIAAKYDMFVSDAYAADLIAFVDATNARIAELEARLRELEPRIEDQEAMLRGPIRSERTWQTKTKT